MKVAVVHELLTIRGGAEKVARALADLYPESPIYTLLWRESALGNWFPRAHIRPSWLQTIAACTGVFRHHAYLPLFPRAVEAWDFRGYDLILSSSSAYTHGLRVPPGTVHVCYVHTPARYLWDHTIAVQERMARPVRAIAARMFHRLRTWDAAVADRPTVLVAASAAVARRIQLYWGRESQVIHPFADDSWFAEPAKAKPTPDGPFLVVANLSHYKRIERAIRACAEIQIPLLIAGDGPAKASLQRAAGNADVQFLGRVEGEALRTLYQQARALLIPAEEDFGINAVEALACGTPVITVRGGGTEEIIDPTVGIVCDATDNAFTAAIASPARVIDPACCRARAEQFTRQHFERSLMDVIRTATA